MRYLEIAHRDWLRTKIPQFFAERNIFETFIIIIVLKIIIKHKQYSSEDLEAAVKLLREGTKMKNVITRYPSIPEPTIRYRASGLDNLQCPGPQPTLGDM